MKVRIADIHIATPDGQEHTVPIYGNATKDNCKSCTHLRKWHNKSCDHCNCEEFIE